jgi:energy-coupling factor transporter ATP-binding protein EcfA2
LKLRGLRERPLKAKILEFMKVFGLDQDMHGPISSYSKGMRQKVLITAALLHDPDILLLDEPLSGLDVTTGLIIRDLIRKLAGEDKIIVYSSHVLEVTEQVCSRIIILHQGHIVANDPLGTRDPRESPVAGRDPSQLSSMRTPIGRDRVVDAMKERLTLAPAAASRLIRMREEFVQFGILARHFFGRLFRNDIVDFEDQMKARLVAVLSVLAVIMGWSSQMLIFFKYELSPDVNTSWQEKNYVFILMMIIFGIVTLLEWEMLFPDRRDFVNLTPLPVRLRTVFAAKLASFVAFIGLFSVAMNSLSSAVFALFLAQWRSNSVLFLVRHVFAHLVSAFAACFCVFFACVFVNFFLMAILPSSFYRRISSCVRSDRLFVFLLLSCRA